MEEERASAAAAAAAAILEEKDTEEEEEGGFLVFNVEEGLETERCDWPSYRRVMNDARERAQTFFRPGPTLGLDTILRTHSHEIKLRRDDGISDFRLMGYQTDRPSYQWLELGYNPSRQHDIPGSSFLDLDYVRNYDDILNAISQGIGIGDILFGQRPLVTAVNLLATSVHRRHRAWALIVVLIMICAASTNPALANYLALQSSYSRPLPKHMKYQILPGFPHTHTVGVESCDYRCCADFPLSNGNGFPVAVEKKKKKCLILDSSHTSA